MFAKSPHCKAIQQHFTVFGSNTNMLTLCEERGLASIVRGPLGMGLLTGKFAAHAAGGRRTARVGLPYR